MKNASGAELVLGTSFVGQRPTWMKNCANWWINELEQQTSHFKITVMADLYADAEPSHELSQKARRRRIVLILVGVFILGALQYPFIKTTSGPPANQRMLNSGIGLYKSMFSCPSPSIFETDPLFDRIIEGDLSLAEEYSSTTELFRDLIRTNALDASFSAFAGPGQKYAKTIVPDEFYPENNAWCVVLSDGGAKDTPCMISRNYLPGVTNLVIGNGAPVAPPLGEGPGPGSLIFDTSKVVVINRIGSGTIYRAKDLRKNPLLPFQGLQATNRVVILRP